MVMFHCVKIHSSLLSILSKKFRPLTDINTPSESEASSSNLLLVRPMSNVDVQEESPRKQEGRAEARSVVSRESKA